MREDPASGNTPPAARLRLFIALPVPEVIKTELGGLQTELRKRLPDDAVRWTALEQVHLTLAFLGDVEASRLEALTAAIREAGATFNPLRLRAERIGFFRHVRSPKVIWAWVHDDWGGLVRLQKAVTSATSGFGNHREEGSFTAHLTIGRVRNLKHADVRTLADAAREMEGKVFEDWTADSVDIMQSELMAGSHRHARLAAIPLKGLGRE